MKYPYVFPYYNYDRKSGGNVVFHYFCHMINQLGGKAYMMVSTTNPSFNTPKLRSLVDFGRHILICPENLNHHDYESSFKVKYVMSDLDMIYKKQMDYTGVDYVLGFSRSLFPKDKGKPNIVHIPIADRNLFNDTGSVMKNKMCFYTGRGYPYIDRHLVDDLRNRGAIEITMDFPETKEGVAKLLRERKVFFAFTATGLIQEAILCGCPVVAMKHDHFTSTYLEGAYCDYGVVEDEKDLPRARKELKKFQELYDHRIEESWEQVKNFMDDTQRLANKKESL